MNTTQNSKKRCPWVPENDLLYTKYHDEEWGRDIKNENKIFELLTLEMSQAGLSWKTVLYKRENYRKAFENFDPVKISKYDDKKVQQLMNDPGIIRNKLKIEATINNAKKFLDIQKEFGSFYKYMWNQIDNKKIIHENKNISDYLEFDQNAHNWSKDLKKRGFKFFGPKIVYSFMQACGMINDHTLDCFCRNS